MFKITSRVLPFAVLLVSLLWGSAFPAIKAIYASWDELGVEQSMSNRLLLAGLRFTVAGLLLLLLAKQPLRDLRRSSFWAVLGVALGQTYFQYVLFYTALSVSSAVLGGLLTGFGSIWWLLLAPLLLKTPWPKLGQWGLVALAFAGVVVAVYRPGVGSGDPFLGALLFAGCTFSGALGVVVLSKVLKTMGARAATGWSLFIGGLLLALTGFEAWGRLPLLFSAEVIGYSLYLVVVSAVGFGIWNYLTGLFSVNLLAGYRFILPICAVFLSSVLVEGEAPGLGIWLGGGLVVVALVLLHRSQHKSQHKSQNKK